MHLVSDWCRGTRRGWRSFGLFGVGGSSFATPLLSLLGLSGFAAVASPLPATLPAALVGARQYARFGYDVDRDVARWSLVGGIPATILGALLSCAGWRSRAPRARPASCWASSGCASCVRSRWRASWPASSAVTGPIHRHRDRRERRPFHGTAREQAASCSSPRTSCCLVCRCAWHWARAWSSSPPLTIPTLVTHWALGHIDWPAAAVFAVGSVPAAWRRVARPNASTPNISSERSVCCSSCSRSGSSPTASTSHRSDRMTVTRRLTAWRGGCKRRSSVLRARRSRSAAVSSPCGSTRSSQ